MGRRENQSMDTKAPTNHASGLSWKVLGLTFCLAFLFEGWSYVSGEENPTSGLDSPTVATEPSSTSENQDSPLMQPTASVAHPDLHRDTAEASSVVQAAATPSVSVRETQPLTAPIGHTLKSPEAQKRIQSLIAAATGAGIKSSRLPLSFEPAKINGIPRALVSLGDRTGTYAFVVEKLHHRLTVFRLNAARRYEVVRTFRAITGKNIEDKKTRGDLKTPEGIYFVTGTPKLKVLPRKYGPMAFTLDYPNIFDERRKKSGDGIWIHGVDDDSRIENPFDTEGCVALRNSDIQELKKYVVPFETAVVITKEMTTTANWTELEDTRSKAMAMVESWKSAWESSDFEAYMGFYSNAFQSLGKDRGAWDRYKRTLSQLRKGDIHVTISEPKILANEDQLLVTFLQEYVAPGHRDFGRKFLYLQWEGDRYRIIAEKWYPETKSDTALNAARPASGSL